MKVYNEDYGYIEKEELRQIRLEEKKENFVMKKQRNKNEETANKEILRCKKYQTTLDDKTH